MDLRFSGSGSPQGSTQTYKRSTIWSRAFRRTWMCDLSLWCYILTLGMLSMQLCIDEWKKQGTNSCPHCKLEPLNFGNINKLVQSILSR